MHWNPCVKGTKYGLIQTWWHHILIWYSFRKSTPFLTVFKASLCVCMYVCRYVCEPSMDSYKHDDIIFSFDITSEKVRHLWLRAKLHRVYVCMYVCEPSMDSYKHDDIIFLFIITSEKVRHLQWPVLVIEVHETAFNDLYHQFTTWYGKTVEKRETDHQCCAYRSRFGLVGVHSVGGQRCEGI